MDLHILSISKAVQHIPEKPTYALRIQTEFTLDHLYDLQESDNYIHTAIYVFDDVWPNMPGGLPSRTTLFSEGLAKKIIEEFEQYKDKVDSLLVHCMRGRNRSPAVAIALNKIFDLGHDTEALEKQYDETNWYVYYTLLAVGGL